MNQLRYVMGVLGVVVLPPGVLFWFLIHPWARLWRRLGPLRAYLIVLPPVVGFAALLVPLRVRLLGTDLGANWALISIDLVLYTATIWLEVGYWRHLDIPTLVGFRELSPADHQEGALLQDGIYGLVRHPRYLSAGVGMVANALVINHAGVYLLIGVLFPVGYVMLLFEERELADRFGEEYRRYQRRVPQLIPRLHRAR